MAKTVVTLCDPCLTDGKETSGQTWRFTIEAPGSKATAYEIDACEMHGEPYRILTAHLADDGRHKGRKGSPVGRPGPPVPGNVAVPADEPNGTVCPVCGYVSSTHGGLRSHIQTAHDKTLSEVLGKASIQCPKCERKTAAIQGLMAHLRAAHGLDLADARAVVRSAGHEIASARE